MVFFLPAIFAVVNMLCINELSAATTTVAVVVVVTAAVTLYSRMLLCLFMGEFELSIVGSCCGGAAAAALNQP